LPLRDLCLIKEERYSLKDNGGGAGKSLIWLSSAAVGMHTDNKNPAVFGPVEYDPEYDYKEQRRQS
jgi:hypothetical protein